MEQVLLRVTAFIYVLAAGTGLRQVLKPGGNRQFHLLLILTLAASVHIAAICARGLQLGGFPIAGVHDGLSVFALLCGLIALVTSWKGAVPQIAALATPLIAVLVLVVSFLEPETSFPASLQSAWLIVHIGLALLGDAAIAIAAVVSVVYLIQERRLKQKKKRKAVTALHNLPALEVLDTTALRLLKWGFPLMTLGLITGALYGYRVSGHFWDWTPRNTISLLVWFLYAGMLHLRLLVGWRGRRAALLTVAGIVVLLIAWVGLGLAGVGGPHGKEFGA